MANLIFGNLSIDMSDPDFFDGLLPTTLTPTPRSVSPTEIVADFPAQPALGLPATRWTISGTIDFFNPFGSVVTGILVTQVSNGALLFSITDIPARTLTEWLNMTPDGLEALVANTPIVVQTGSGIDDLIGNLTDDQFYAGGGNDILDGLFGNDTLDGGTGADVMNGGPGNDSYFVDDLRDVIVEGVGDGTDTVQAATSFRLPDNVETLLLTGNALIGVGNALDNAVSGTETPNWLGGRGGNDTVSGNGGIDALLGGSGNDTLDGGSDGDYLGGGTGDDVLRGGAGNDILLGWLGDDVLEGGTGNDRLRGGPGTDQLLGGDGDDLLVFDALDTLVDGGAGFDTLAVGAEASIDLTLLPDGRLLGIERVLLAGPGANTLTLAAADLLALSDTTDTLVVDGGSEDLVVLAGGGWTDGGIASGYHTYTSGGATILVDAEVALNLA